MHRCLQIPELVLQIAEELHPGYKDSPAEGGTTPSGSEGAADVAALARTCRAFLGPALDVLWYTQHDFRRVLELLNTSSCVVDVSEGSRTVSKRWTSRSAAEIRDWVRSYHLYCSPLLTPGNTKGPCTRTQLRACVLATSEFLRSSDS